MYKLGLKLWSTNVDNYLHEAERLYADRVYDYIELFIVPETLHTLSAWRELQLRSGVPFVMHNAHSMKGFNLADPSMQESNLEIYKQTKLFADTLNATNIIFHGGVGGTIDEVARQLKSFNEPRALIENKPYSPLASLNINATCRGASFEEIVYIINETKCGFCLDIGHAVCAANSFGIEPYEYVKKFNSLKPLMYHLSDILDMTSQYDAHPHLGSGSLDMKRLCAEVFSNETMISIETVKNSKTTLEDYLADVQHLKSIMANRSL